MKFKVVYEDSDILVVDKPAGLVVNRSQTSSEETLQDQLSDYFNSGQDLGIGDRAGIVHRLDRETSGLLVVAKNQETFEALQTEFKNRRVEKEYVALVHGLMTEDSGSIEGRTGRVGRFGKFGIVDDGREARTDWKLAKRFKIKESRFRNQVQALTKARTNYLKNHARDYSLLHLFPKTGRTHQIRVHLKSIGHPVVSDLIYGPPRLLKFDLLWCPRLFLHAAKLSFRMPGRSASRRIVFESRMPYDLEEALSALDPPAGGQDLPNG